ncbi:MAG TPA: type II secretion system F family protein [Azospira sp.]|nr:type II secretion system F family protein [Azospira sp.]
MDYLYYLFIICAFLAVVLALEGVLMIWNTYRGPEARRIEQRLRSMAGGEAGGEASLLLRKRVLSEMPAMQRLLQRVPRVHLLDRMLQQAGSEMTVGSFFLISSAFALLGLLLALVLRLPLILVLAVAAGFSLLPLGRLLANRAKRLDKFEQQLPDTLDLIARALRAGHSFPSGLEMVAEEMPEPTAGEFRTAFDEINFGISVQEALLNLASRVPVNDLSYFVVAVLIQRETGGNLAELLDTLSRLIRERFRLLLKVRALSAEGRMSAWILSFMPFVVAFLLYLVHRDFMAVLWNDSVGFKMMMFAIAFMVVGIIWMWRVIKIRV